MNECKKVKKVAVKQIFKNIKETTDFDFLFRTGVVDANGNHYTDVKTALFQAKKEARFDGKTGTR